MIQSWGNEAAEAIFMGRCHPRVPAAVTAAAKRRLDQLAAAPTVESMRVPPGNRLHALTGKLEGWWSVSANAQYRIIFRWSAGAPGPSDVAFVDYH